MTWTDARTKLLTRLWAEGVSASGIAKALGDVSRSAVLGKLHRLDLLGSRLPAAPPRRFDGPTRAWASAPTAAAPLFRPAAAPAQAAASPPTPPTPPRSPWREAVFAPLAATAPRPWLTRDFGECAFPVGGDGAALLSCCARVRPRSAYCAAHHAIVFRTPAWPATAAGARRGEDAAERWAA
jgi:GcrA cell cycle regulator